MALITSFFLILIIVTQRQDRSARVETSSLLSGGDSDEEMVAERTIPRPVPEKKAESSKGHVPIYEDCEAFSSAEA